MKCRMQQSSSGEESKENEFLFEIKIPERVNTDSMTSNIEDGILTISLLFKSTKVCINFNFILLECDYTCHRCSVF